MIIILIFSAILHEYAHGFVAYIHGDPTAKNMGRLTFNPIPHIDPFFTIILPVMMVLMPTGFVIGGAKPVPVNPFNLRGKYAELKVAMAGPFSNIALAVLFGLFIRFVPIIKESNSLLLGFGMVVFINLLLAFFNLLPIPPLDGSHLLISVFPGLSRSAKIFLSQNGFYIFLFIIIFFWRYLFGLLYFLISLLFYPITGITLMEFFSLM